MWGDGWEALVCHGGGMQKECRAGEKNTWADKKVKKGIKRSLCKLITVIFVFSIHIAVCLAPADINHQHCA